MQINTTSTIRTQLMLTREEYMMTLTAIELAKELAPQAEHFKYERIGKLVGGYAPPAPGEQVGIPMNLRKLKFVRRILTNGAQRALQLGAAELIARTADLADRVQANCSALHQLVDA